MKLLSRNSSNEIFSEKKQAGDPNASAFIDAVGIGVKYTLEIKRDDLQSRAFNLLPGKKSKSEPFWALKDLNITVTTGDILGIIGSNGAGKTTLCRIVSGLLKPDTGSIEMRGTVSALLSLGTGFKKELSGIENIIMNGLMLGFSKKEMHDKIPEIIDFSGLQDFIYQPLKTYSSGMRSRLGFSIAVSVQPDILVLDEALSAGDLEFNEKAALKLQEIVSRASLVMIVTHNMGFVEEYCNKAVWIDRGQMKAFGEPLDVVEKYKETVSHKSSQQRKKSKIVNLKKTALQQSEEEVVIANNISVDYPVANTNVQTGNNNSYRLTNIIPAGNKEAFRALQEISFRVKEGEIVGIIGPNGAGKTTLCKVISGIIKPDNGIITVRGETTALLSLSTGFNIQLTGRDNIYLNGMMLGMSRKKLNNLYNDIVDFSELEKFITRPVKIYSSGMKSRLGFSIAAMIQPDIFIIDEALSTGDISFYEKASNKIQELINNAKAVIIVTHNMKFVEKVCTRAIWLDQGRILYDGKPKKVVKKYKQKKVRIKSR